MHRANMRALRNYGAACRRIGGSPGSRYNRRIVLALWRADQGRNRRFETRITADGDKIIRRRGDVR